MYYQQNNQPNYKDITISLNTANAKIEQLEQDDKLSQKTIINLQQEVADWELKETVKNKKISDYESLIISIASVIDEKEYDLEEELDRGFNLIWDLRRKIYEWKNDVIFIRNNRVQLLEKYKELKNAKNLLLTRLEAKEREIKELKEKQNQ